MEPIRADYYDGKNARRHVAGISVVGDVVVVAREGGASEYPVSSVRVQPQLKGAPRRIEFPDGSAALTGDHAAVEVVFGLAGARTLAHRLESHLGFVFAALIGVVVAVGLGYFYGLPWMAREVAQHMPIGIESQIAEVGMNSLDQAVFRPSALDAGARQPIAAAFAELRAASGLPAEVRLEFRDGGWIGANAFALPGGVVVVTDQLVVAMPGLDEMAAVLAHELGHVRHRHSLRHLLQDSLAALAAAAIYGDVASLTSIAVTTPTVLAHNGYSRDFEREADAFAFALLRETGRSPKAFATAMRALERAHDALPRKEDRLRRKLGLPEAGKGPPDESGKPDTQGDRGARDFGYLSTHPTTEERIRAAEAAGAAP